MTSPAHPQDDRLLRHGMLLMVWSQVANAANILFHMVMGRHLSADQYGILSTMLNMLLIVSTPMDALRGALAHFTARAHRAGEPEVIRALLVKWTKRVSSMAVPAGLLLLVFHRHVASFFHLPSATPVCIVAILLPGFLFLPILAGVLQGVQAFVWMAASSHGWFVFRLVMGWLLVTYVAANATMGVTAHALGLIFSMGAGLWGVWTVTRGAGRGGEATRGVGSYFMNSLIVLGAFGALMNCDMMLVRHYLPAQAGHYAWAATIARSVVFLPMPIALAMFPKVISSGGTSRASRRTLFKAILVVAGMIGCAAAATWALPWLPLRILYGKDAVLPETTALVRIVALAMSPLGLSYLLLQFEMAQHRFGAIPWLLALVAAYLGGVAVCHATVAQVVAVLGVVSTLCVVVYAVALFRAGRAAGAHAEP